MSKNKIIWVDIGTHFGQEYKSVFSNDLWFILKIIKRFLVKFLLKKGEILSLKSFFNILGYRRFIKKHKSIFRIIFVEANQMLLAKSVYRKADDVFNIALKSNKNTEDLISKLYIVNNNSISEGNSIYLSKPNINDQHYISCISVQSNYFAKSLKLFLDNQYSKYEIILRINCEGSEDDIIYSFHNEFANKFNIVFGSLKDVKEIKGRKAFMNLNSFLKEKNIKFISFSSSILSWENSHNEIVKILKRFKKP